MAFKDHYQALGVSPSASADAIKRSFRKLAMELHPDKHNNSAAATEKFSRINEAYAVLSDPKKRAEYNYQRYLNHPHYKEKPLARSAEEILLQSSKLAVDIQHRDPLRIDRDILLFQLMELLSAHNLGILEEEKNNAVKTSILQNILASAVHLPFPYAKPLFSKLNVLAENDAGSTRLITQFVRQSSQQYFWNRYKIYVALALAALFCFLTYLATKGNQAV